jgi:hypothetical protein
VLSLAVGGGGLPFTHSCRWPRSAPARQGFCTEWDPAGVLRLRGQRVIGPGGQATADNHARTPDIRATRHALPVQERIEPVQIREGGFRVHR